MYISISFHLGTLNIVPNNTQTLLYFMTRLTDELLKHLIWICAVVVAVISEKHCFPLKPMHTHSDDDGKPKLVEITVYYY